MPAVVKLMFTPVPVVRFPSVVVPLPAASRENVKERPSANVVFDPDTQGEAYVVPLAAQRAAVQLPVEIVDVESWALAVGAISNTVATAAATSAIGLPRRRKTPAFTAPDSLADSIALI